MESEGVKNNKSVEESPQNGQRQRGQREERGRSTRRGFRGEGNPPQQREKNYEWERNSHMTLHGREVIGCFLLGTATVLPACGVFPYTCCGAHGTPAASAGAVHEQEALTPSPSGK